MNRSIPKFNNHYVRHCNLQVSLLIFKFFFSSTNNTFFCLSLEISEIVSSFFWFLIKLFYLQIHNTYLWNMWLSELYFKILFCEHLNPNEWSIMQGSSTPNSFIVNYRNQSHEWITNRLSWINQTNHANVYFSEKQSVNYGY